MLISFLMITKNLPLGQALPISKHSVINKINYLYITRKGCCANESVECPSYKRSVVISVCYKCKSYGGRETGAIACKF